MGRGLALPFSGQRIQYAVLCGAFWSSRRACDGHWLRGRVGWLSGGKTPRDSGIHVGHTEEEVFQVAAFHLNINLAKRVRPKFELYTPLAGPRYRERAAALRHKGLGGVIGKLVCGLGSHNDIEDTELARPLMAVISSLGSMTVQP